MKYITISEAAKMLNKSRQWVWFLIKTKQIKAQKTGSIILIDKSKVEEYLRRPKGISKECK
jgi:excisionase family DNA binding protein